MDDESELLAAWRDGDTAAGNQLLRKHFKPIFRFFATKVGDLAEDLAQKTFLGAVQSRDRFREGSTFRTYLFAIARRQLYMHFRTQGRRGSDEELHESSVFELGGSPSSVVVAHQEQELLLQALRRIPVDYQIALELYYWEEMTMGDVAVVLDVAEGTVKSRLSRARSALRDVIGSLEASPELRESTLHGLDTWAKNLRAQLPEPD